MARRSAAPLESSCPGTSLALPLFIAHGFDKSTRIRVRALPACAPGAQPVQLRLGHWAGRWAHRAQLDYRLAAAGNDNGLPPEGSLDKFRELVLRFGNAMSTHRIIR